jgi:hypothetical protein
VFLLPLRWGFWLVGVVGIPLGVVGDSGFGVGWCLMVVLRGLGGFFLESCYGLNS